MITPPKFNSSPLKNDGWKTTFLLGWYIFSGYVKLPGGTATVTTTTGGSIQMRCLVSGKLSTWNYREILVFLKRGFHINNMMNMFVSFPGCNLKFGCFHWYPGWSLMMNIFILLDVWSNYMFCILIQDRMSIWLDPPIFIDQPVRLSSHAIHLPLAAVLAMTGQLTQEKTHGADRVTKYTWKPAQVKTHKMGWQHSRRL